MANPAKRKGSKWESDVRDYLAAHLGLRVERIPAGAAHDRGDLSGLPGVAVECKNVQRIDLSTIVDEARTEASNVGDGTLPVAIVKRRNRPTGDAYVVMPLDAWATMFGRSL